MGPPLLGGDDVTEEIRMSWTVQASEWQNCITIHKCIISAPNRSVLAQNGGQDIKTDFSHAQMLMVLYFYI